jgi:predicted glycosyltransferase involved in capsule biosynthesis
MFDLSNVTFLIPYRCDSNDRLRNIKACVSYLKANFTTNIFVMEEAPERTFFDTAGIRYQFNKTDSPLMHRTRMLNDMCKMSVTPIIVLMDTDVFLPPNQLWDAQQLIRSNQFDVVYPYSGKFMNYIEPYISKIILTNSLDGINESHGHLIHPASIGGCIMFNKNKFIDGGMENEHHVSWGWEDNDRLHRFGTLGYRITRINGIIYHLNHASSTNSANTSHDAYHNNQREFSKVANMSKDQLQHYIKTWAWVPK